MIKIIEASSTYLLEQYFDKWKRRKEEMLIDIEIKSVQMVEGKDKWYLVVLYDE